MKIIFILPFLKNLLLLIFSRFKYTRLYDYDFHTFSELTWKSHVHLHVRTCYQNNTNILTRFHFISIFYSTPFHDDYYFFSFHVTFCLAPKLKEYMRYTSVPYCIPFHTQKVQKAKEITNKALLQTFLFSFLIVSSIVILFNKKVRACHHHHSSHLTTPKLSSFSSSSSPPLIFTTCHCTMFAFFFSSLSLESSSSSSFSHYPSCSEYL